MKQQPEIQLVRFFHRNGSLRIRNKQRLEKEGYMNYKKGYEVRFTAENEEELELMNDLLKEAGFKPGKPYSKSLRYIFPVYGKEAVEQFQKLLLEIKP